MPAVAVIAAAAGVAVALSGADQATPTPADAPANTAPVERGDLSAMVSQGGTLTYRARPDGSPYPVINQAGGVYTKLPETGDKVDCGDVLYRVDDKPVLLLCGTVPAYRNLHRGAAGKDVRQLNRNLHQGGRRFTAKTEKALKALQRRQGARVDRSPRRRRRGVPARAGADRQGDRRARRRRPAGCAGPGRDLRPPARAAEP